MLSAPLNTAPQGIRSKDIASCQGHAFLKKPDRRYQKRLLYPESAEEKEGTS
jgi:hypothetical protein